METKTYSFAGQRIAMKRDGILTYLHSDHLGSAVLETNASGQIVADQRYYAYGKQRDSGPVGTDHRFTGQQQDGSGLVYMNARYYDPVLGQFISPDTLVPDAGLLVDYNRYGYARGNPLKYSDPSGHQACAAGNNACWQNEWNWKNRWYLAHGFDWSPADSHWAAPIHAQFLDTGIFQDTMSEAGIRFDSGLFGRWQWAQSEMELIGQAVVALGNKVGGMVRLQALLGGGMTIFERNRIDGGSSLAAMVGYGRFQLRGLYQNWISVFDNAFGNDDFTRGLTAHELAHVIDFGSPAGYRWLSSNIPAGGDQFVGDYGRSGNSLEYFAEAVAMWVYPSIAPGSYGANRNSQDPIPPGIEQFLQANLVAVP